MRKAIKQIGVCALGLFLICLLCRLIFFRTYTVHIPIHPGSPMAQAVAEDAPRARMEEPNVARPDDVRVHPDHLSVRIHPGSAGETDLQIVDPQGEEISFSVLRVTRSGTVIDLSTGGFNGDVVVLFAVALFWLTVSAIMIWHYFQAKGPAYYAYSTVYYAGFSLFALVTGLLMLRVSLLHLFQPEDYSMFSAYRTIEGASREFMILTMPLMLAFAAAMAVSNIALLLHERHRLWNALGLMVSGLLILGETIGFLLFTRDFAGPEWEARMNNTVENVYATVFVYFECMLVGAVICGLTAARHQPAPDKDFIVILGCWFRKDGTLPPLLRGRVDRAIAFWRKQKEQTGKEAVLIPSGGQGKNESMPEAEAMRRYMLDQGIPDSLIVPETQSRNTWENMAFSKAIIEKMSDAGKILFATTNYHVFRSGIWADSAGLQAEGIGSRTKWWYWPNAFMRECIGLMQKSWKQELFLLILFVALYGALSLLL